MNPDRQIRFLYPPILILAFLMWAIVEDSELKLKVLALLSATPESLKGLVGALVGGSTAILIIGFVSGTVTFLTLRIIFAVFGCRTHEVPISENCRRRIWTALMPSPVIEHRKILFATAYLHFGICSKEVADWIARRWNAFNLSANICFGIALVMASVGWFELLHPASFWWFGVGAGALVLFFANAFFAWRDTMGMVTFCAEIHSNKRV